MAKIREALILKMQLEAFEDKLTYLDERKAHKFYTIFKFEGPREIIFKSKQKYTEIEYTKLLLKSIKKSLEFRTYINYNRQNKKLIQIKNKKFLYTLVRKYSVISRKYRKLNALPISNINGNQSVFSELTKFDRSKADFSKGLYFGNQLAKDPNNIDMIIKHKTLLELKKHYLKTYEKGKYYDD